MTRHWSAPILLTSSLILAAGVYISSCGKPETRIDALRNQYQLTDVEAAKWGRLHVEEAESVAVALWYHVGHGDFDAVTLLVQRYGVANMDSLFTKRITDLWSRMVTLPAAGFLKEPQLQVLGEGNTVGFVTWGDLFSGGFQRAVLSDDSITVYFVFKGYWQTTSMPVYAAVACGDFGTEEPQWRPFAHLIFSMDASDETIKFTGKVQFRRDMTQFLDYLRTRRFGEGMPEKH